MMFKIGDYAVCPGHGVGQVCDIEKKDLGGNEAQFYVLKILSNGMTVMVPTSSKEGIRELVSSEEIEKVFSVLSDHSVEIDNSTWNRRYREYMLKIKTGSLQEIAEVLRALFLLKKIKNLSFGEKKMLDQCKDLLAQEISLAKSQDKNEIKLRIDAQFSSLT
jgi:CarD family transcriptional regulator